MILAGTGHRPTKLGGYSEDAYWKLVGFLKNYLNNGPFDPELVITGGALGYDQALANACLITGTEYILCLPFPGFESRWPQASQDRLKELAEAASLVEWAGLEYSPDIYQKRNILMVDNSDRLLALWDGSSGGTNNCVGYAHKVEKNVTNLWGAWQEWLHS